MNFLFLLLADAHAGVIPSYYCIRVIHHFRSCSQYATVYVCQLYVWNYIVR